MSTLQSALALASRGFHVFPLQVNGKLPIIDEYPTRATRDPEQIKKWWGTRAYNVGISTTRFDEDKALVVVDVDVKKGKKGDETLVRLELDGCDFPTTCESETPTAGRHLIYVCDEPLKQGADVLGSGLDIRSRGGYIVGPGSLIDGKPYFQVNGHSHLAPAPAWLVDRLGVDRRDPASAVAVLPGVDPDRARDRALAYLKTAPLAVEGEAGDMTTYKVAAKLKDLGCDLDMALDLMVYAWNDRCTPPWSMDELTDKVSHAYKYGREPQGIDAPEAVFPPEPPAPGEPELDHPFEELNKQFAFIFAGGTGNILWETTDPKGNYAFHLMNKASFQDKLAAQKIQIGDKTRPITQLWMEWPKRRTFDGIVFEPGRDAGPRWYNMWRGFSVQPAEHGNHPMVERWKEHLLQNVCRGDANLADWLTGWFAHLIQRPWEKPLVAVVFKGSKGVGKNALVERICKLLGGHAMVTSRRRYLVSNFTLHLQKSLVFVLDEAFWSGDKEAEGVVKDLVTGDTHIIEPKGKESYTVRNLTRVVVIGNEDWLVPASADERRWAVFDIGNGRKQDRAYFEEMRIGLDEEGGSAHLLRYLLDYKISQDVNAAPNTQALLDQKIASLEPIPQWWYDCLTQGQLAGGDFGGEWPIDIHTNRLRTAFNRWARERNIRCRMSDKAFIQALHICAPSLIRVKSARAQPGDTTYAYRNKGIDALRKEWDAYLGGATSWE